MSKKDKKHKDISDNNSRYDNFEKTEDMGAGKTDTTGGGMTGGEDRSDGRDEKETVTAPRTVAGVSVVDPGTHALEAPVPETRRDKFFNIMNIFGDLVFLNIAFALSCIPLITIGAAFTALYTMTLKMVRKEEGNVLLGYFDAFKKNFIPATKAWIVIILYFWIMYIEYVFMLRTDGTYYNILLMMMGIELLILSFTLPLLFPLIARYENTTLNYFKNSIVLSLSKISVWIRVYISWIGPLLITLARPEVLYYGWFVWVFILCSLLAYSSSLVIRKLFEDMEAAEESRKNEQKNQKAQKSGSMKDKVHSADKN